MIQSKQKPRHLNFNQFLQQRAEQISKFRTILQQDTKKKGHQSLPKTIRRRAMSHNRYRIPSKLRKNMEQDLIKSQNMQKVPKCRKHIRKRNRLILSYKQRFSKVHWLNNHLWSARRMKMVNYYGYKVGYSPNDKCFRSSYRHFRSNCCLTNLSFYQCLKIRLNNQQPPKNLVFENSIVQLEQNLMYKANLFRISEGKQLICPLTVFKTVVHKQNFSSATQLKCFFHPAALQQVRKCKIVNWQNKQMYNVSIQKINSQFYVLIGPQWANTIQTALKRYQMTDQLSETFVRNSANKQLYLRAKQNSQLQNIPKISDQINQQKLLKKSYSQKSCQQIRQKTLALLAFLNKDKQSKMQTQQKQTAQEQFWRFYEKAQNQQIQFKITTRSKYTHKRKSKLSKQTKKKVITLQKQKRKVLMSEEDDDSLKEQSSKELQSIKKQIKQIFIEESKKVQKNNQIFIKQKQTKVDPLMISPFREGLYEGCYIFCSKNDNCRLWRILSHLNIKIIGLQQHKHILLQSQKLSFPEDYHQTNSFQQYAKTDGLKTFKTLKRRPSQKRTNFIRVKSPSPFSLTSELNMKQAKTVYIQMVSRGRCFNNSYIYQLSKQDLEQIEKQLQASGNIKTILSEIDKSENVEPIKEQFLNYDKNLLQIKGQLQCLKTKRRLIGRISSGGYLYNKSREGGIGFICGNAFQNISKNDGYVLVRKITSPYYFLGVIIQSYETLTTLSRQ